MDKKWKQWERDVATLIGGGRYPANSGHELDCGPDATHPDCRFVAQVKLVSRLSLGDLTELVETVSSYGATLDKVGIVAVKAKTGKGHPATGLIVMTMGTFSMLFRRSEPKATAPKA